MHIEYLTVYTEVNNRLAVSKSVSGRLIPTYSQVTYMLRGTDTVNAHHSQRIKYGFLIHYTANSQMMHELNGRYNYDYATIILVHLLDIGVT